MRLTLPYRQNDANTPHILKRKISINTLLVLFDTFLGNEKESQTINMCEINKKLSQLCHKNDAWEWLKTIVFDYVEVEKKRAACKLEESRWNRGRGMKKCNVLHQGVVSKAQVSSLQDFN